MKCHFIVSFKMNFVFNCLQTSLVCFIFFGPYEMREENTGILRVRSMSRTSVDLFSPRVSYMDAKKKSVCVCVFESAGNCNELFSVFSHFNNCYSIIKSEWVEKDVDSCYDFNAISCTAERLMNSAQNCMNISIKLYYS